MDARRGDTGGDSASGHDRIVAGHEARHRASDEFDPMYPDGAASFPLPWEAAAIVARAVFYAVSSADETALALHAAQDACAAVQTTAAPADIDAGRAERRWQQVHLPEPARRLRWLTERLY